MQSRAVEFAKEVEFEVRIDVLKVAGTVTKEETPSMEDILIRGISLDRHQAKLSIAGVRDKHCKLPHGSSPTSCGAHHSRHDRAECVRWGTTDISFTIHEDELENARTILMPVLGELGAERLNTASGVAKLSVVGPSDSHSGRLQRECSNAWAAGSIFSWSQRRRSRSPLLLTKKKPSALRDDRRPVRPGTIAARHCRNAAACLIGYFFRTGSM